MRTLLLLAHCGACMALRPTVSLTARHALRIGNELKSYRTPAPRAEADANGQENDAEKIPERQRDLFIPSLVAVAFSGYALIVLYDIFFGNGLCGVTVQCSSTPWG